MLTAACFGQAAKIACRLRHEAYPKLSSKSRAVPLAGTNLRLPNITRQESAIDELDQPYHGRLVELMTRVSFVCDVGSRTGRCVFASQVSHQR